MPVPTHHSTNRVDQPIDLFVNGPAHTTFLHVGILYRQGLLPHWSVCCSTGRSDNYARKSPHLIHHNDWGCTYIARATQYITSIGLHLRRTSYPTHPTSQEPHLIHHINWAAPKSQEPHQIYHIDWGFVYVPTEEMIADGLTKGLLKARHDQFIDICDGRYLKLYGSEDPR